MKRSITRTTFTLLVVYCIGFAFFEGVTRLLAYKGLVPFRTYPTEKQRMLADIDPHFGVWRHPDRVTRHQGACFNVSYETNSFGMRDRKRSLKAGSTKRHIILGDSFVEGYGVPASERFTDILENALGEEFLNFGVSGNFGSTQQYLLYKELASKFEHDSVSIFLLPDNDFEDNDQANFDPDRFRPYLRQIKNTDSFEVFYTTSFEEREASETLSAGRRFRRHLYNNVYLLNVMRQLGDIFESSGVKDSMSDALAERQHSSYNRYTEQDFAKLRWGYEQIARLAYPRQVTIFVIPREIDFLTLNTAERYRNARLIPELETFAAKHANIEVLDLLPGFQAHLRHTQQDEDGMFLPCDGHWSAAGHSVVAQIYREARARKTKTTSLSRS
jgi:hypothetical protein